MAETKVDLRGLKCPLPALRTRKLLAAMAVGDILEIECSDPLASVDIPHLVRETGDAIEAQRVQGRILIFRIRKV